MLCFTASLTQPKFRLGDLSSVWLLKELFFDILLSRNNRIATPMINNKAGILSIPALHYRFLTVRESPVALLALKQEEW